MRTSTDIRSSEVLALRVPSSSRLRRTHCPAAGFTLLELSIILLVLGIAVSFLIPRLRDADRTRLTASAERLATVARYLYDEAAFRQRPMRLNFDLDNQTYWISVLNDDPDDPEFVPDGSPLSRPAALPDAVSFVDVVLPVLGVVTRGAVFAQFLPEGSADPFAVHLQTRRGEYATTALDALTGRTRTADGYFEVAVVAPGGVGRDDADRRDSDAARRATSAGRTSR
jgi:general secretion pathway protein H